MLSRGHHRGLFIVSKHTSFPEVRLHQCPSEKTGHAEPGRGRSVTSHVPTHTQTAAKARDFARAAPLSIGETDSPLERSGFEISVLRSLATANSMGAFVSAVSGGP